MAEKNNLLKILGKLDDYLLIIGVIWMGIVLTLQIVMRYAFNNPLAWSEEMARYVFVWICFLGVGYGIKNDLHIKMEIFFNFFPKIVQKVLSILTNIMMIVFLIIIIPPGIDFSVQVNEVASSAMEIPMSWVYISVPIGLSVGVIRLVIDTIKLFTAGEKEVTNASISK